jgi:hypothetical protein
MQIAPSVSWSFNLSGQPLDYEQIKVHRTVHRADA